MAQAYSDPSRADDPHALPDLEVWYEDGNGESPDVAFDDPNEEPGPLAAGWYYWTCLPGCLPDGDPIGPFADEAEALADAREGL